VTFRISCRRAPVAFVTSIAQSRPLSLALISWPFLQAHESVNRRLVFGMMAIAAEMRF